MMNNNIKISIVVLLYKKFDNLKYNFQSISKQNYHNYEVILQDDGSDNFDLKYIMDLASEIHIDVSVESNHKNCGTVKNYNKAILRCSGDIIVPLSQDDVFCDEHSLEYIVNFFEENQVDVCFAKRKGKISGRVYPDKKDIELMNKCDNNLLWGRLAVNNFISGSVLYWRKDYLINNLFDERYILMEDYPKIMDLVYKRKKIGFIDENIIIYGEKGVVGGGKVNKLLNKDKLLLIEDLIRGDYIGEIKGINLLKKFLELKLYLVENNTNWGLSVPIRLWYVNIIFMCCKIVSKIFGVSSDYILAKILLKQK
ncbi:glycosyltransferase family 2 protein [Selenomonas ruminantium]|uniref:glycosyltransferase family 2 protein n=1 Tax=Selenomonas ruminantium TaxID=971 RepID=UPI0009B74AF4|nr:glycosyltransferase [Selenomonas ruminantium]